jgi:hypothetical protein
VIPESAKKGGISVRFHNRILLIALFVCVAGLLCLLQAHTALLFLEDNGDGTLYIQTGVSTGESSGGSKIIIRDKETGQPLSTLSMPDSGKINIPLPKVPYTVTMDMGAGHIVIKTGPFTEATGRKDSGLTTSGSPYAAHKKRSAGLLTIIAVAVLVTVSGRLFTARKKGPK